MVLNHMERDFYVKMNLICIKGVENMIRPAVKEDAKN